MLVTIKATQSTTHFPVGEVRTVELTPFVRGLLRNGLAVQIPRTDPDPVPAKAAPKKTARRVVKKTTDEPDPVLAELAPNAREFVSAAKLDPEQE